jgi:hypothetical protein
MLQLAGFCGEGVEEGVVLSGDGLVWCHDGEVGMEGWEKEGYGDELFAGIICHGGGRCETRRD